MKKIASFWNEKVKKRIPRIITIAFVLTCIDIINVIADFKAIQISLSLLITAYCWELIKDISNTRETKEIIRKGFISVIIMILAIFWMVILR